MSTQAAQADHAHSAPETPGDQAQPEGFGDFAASIGTRNLLIAIVTMPFVFFLVVMAILAVFGPPGGDDDAAEASSVEASSIATITEPAPASRVIAPTQVSAALPTRMRRRRLPCPKAARLAPFLLMAIGSRCGSIPPAAARSSYLICRRMKSCNGLRFRQPNNPASITPRALLSCAREKLDPAAAR